MEHPALDQHVVLARVMNLCGSQVPQDWNTLGIQLGLMPGDINTISATGHMDPIRRIQDMFSAWLRVDPEPTWRKLLKALRTPTVKQDVLAYNIQHELTKPK